MKLGYLPNILLTLLVSSLLVACSGGEGGTGAAPKSVSVGAITELGSVVVNGVRFDTNSSAITLEGVVGNQSDLKVGMVVVVQGRINADHVTGTAESVAAEEVLIGPIESTLNINEIVVLGQTVELSQDTIYENGYTPQLGNIVEVSGVVKEDGVVAATRIALKPQDTTEFKLKGFVKDMIGLNFSIGSLNNFLTIDASQADLSGLPGNTLSNDLFVEVKGSLPTLALFVANEIEEDKLEVDDADEFELEGFVGSVVGNTFVLNNIQVNWDGTTEFQGGVATDIAVGIKLEVEGALVNGVLIAEEIAFQERFKLESNVQSVNLSAQTFTLLGLGSISVSVNNLTEFEPSTANLTNINGQKVKVRGKQIGGLTSSVIATKIEVSTPQIGNSVDIELQGLVQSKNNPDFTILGYTVSSMTSSYKHRGTPVDITTFFNTVEVESLVEAKGVYNKMGASIDWQEIELEN